MRMRSLSGGDDLFVRGAGLAHGDVVADSTGGKPRILQHHADVFAQVMPAQAAGFLAVNADFAGVHIVKAHEQVDHGRLAAAGRADDGNALTGLDLKGEILDQGSVRRVGEGDGGKRNTALRDVERFGGAGVGRLCRLIDELKNACGTGDGILQLGDDAGNLVKGLGVLVGVGQETRQTADGEPARNHGKRAGKTDARINKGIDKARARVGQRGEEHRAQGTGAQAAVDLIELIENLVLAGEGLDELLLKDCFIDQRGVLTAGF